MLRLRGMPHSRTSLPPFRTEANPSHSLLLQWTTVHLHSEQLTKGATGFFSKAKMLRIA